MVQVKDTITVGRKCDAASVRRPHRHPVETGGRGEARASSPREFVQPDVQVSYWADSSSGNLGVVAAERYPRSVGREGHAVVLAGLTNCPEDLPCSIEPGELGGWEWSACPGPVSQNASRRDRKPRGTSIREALGDRHGLAGQLQPAGIESLGHQRALPHKE